MVGIVARIGDIAQTDLSSRVRIGAYFVCCVIGAADRDDVLGLHQADRLGAVEASRLRDD